MPRIHLYGQKETTADQPLTVRDIRSIAHFNRIIKNYIKMQNITKKNAS